jgi:hypothetical protein
MRFIITSIFFIALGICLSAQEPLMRNFDFSITLGMADISVDKFSLNENVDFMNYMNYDLDYIDLSTIKLGWHYDFLEGMHADFDLIIMSDLVPDNFDFSLHYFPVKFLGVGMGSVYYTNYISYFEEYHQETNPDFYLLDQNQRQFETYDLGFYISPVLRPIYSDRFKVILRCDLGFSSMMEEHTSFYLKRKLSNDLRLYDYKTVKTFQPFIYPKAKMMLTVFKRGDSSLGILFNSNYFYSKKSINYDRTYQVWTTENSIEEKIAPPKHRYSRLELEGGIFYRWK